MDYQLIKDCLIDLGFTKDKIAPLFILLLGAYFLINRKFNSIKKIVDKLEDFIIRLCGALESGGNIKKIELYKKNSPIQLTQEGIKILEKIGFKEGIDQNIDVLIKIIDHIKPKSAFDTEQICAGLIRYVMSDKELTIFNKAEDFLYNHPKYNKSEYFKAAGLYLRDKYFEKNPKLLKRATKSSKSSKKK